MAEQPELEIASDDPPRVSTGSKGLDGILGGGLDENRMYLYEGRPGTGKTTLALQFLLDGARRGERVLYISLSETVEELRLVAKRHGWSLDGVDVFELVTPETTLDPERELTVLHPAEVELSETTQLVFDRVEKLNATRVVFDSLSELRLLAQSALRYIGWRDGGARQVRGSAQCKEEAALKDRCTVTSGGTAGRLVVG